MTRPSLEEHLAPVLGRLARHLTPHGLTVNDAKARFELGYVGHMTRDAGLAELRG